MNSKQIGLRIRRARRAQELTQKELGRLTAIHPKMLSRIEQGNFTDITLSTLMAIARVLELSLDDLIDESQQCPALTVPAEH